MELKDMKINTLVCAIEKIVATYKSRGFSIKGMVADNGFEPLKANIRFLNLPVPLSTTSEDEHEPFPERLIKSLKERCKMTFSTISYKKYQKEWSLN